MKEVFEHEGKKYILIEGQGGNSDTTCIGCSFRNTEEDACVRGKIFEHHNCSERTDIFVPMPIPGPKKKLEL